MSVGVLQSTDLMGAAARGAEQKSAQTVHAASGWSPENFAREQIRGLVRQVFFSSAMYPVRQVVFCGADSHTNVGSLCRQVGQSLALDTSGNVAIVSHEQIPADRLHTQENDVAERITRLRPCATRIQKNLWLMPHTYFGQDGGFSNSSLSSRLSDLRGEFEFSIVQAAAAGESSEAAALGQFADGIVVVLAAHFTRRATALKIKEMLEGARVRLLGTVLSERRFPIPEAIYRRL